MFDMIGVAPICVRADREVQGSICERFILPDNPRRTSGPIEVFHKIFPPILGRGKSGLNRAKNPVAAFKFKHIRSAFTLKYNGKLPQWNEKCVLSE